MNLTHEKALASGLTPLDERQLLIALLRGIPRRSRARSTIEDRLADLTRDEIATDIAADRFAVAFAEEMEAGIDG